MPTTDEEFIKKLRATFRVEAEEHLQAISSMLLALEKAPAEARDATTVENVYREAHSLKGASRAVDMTDIEGICQGMESMLAAWKRQAVAPSPEAFDTLHHALDMIHELLTPGNTEQIGSQKRRRENLIQSMEGRQGGEGEGAAAGRDKPAAKAEVEVVSAPAAGEVASQPVPARESVSQAGPVAGAAAGSAAGPVEAEKHIGEETVRIAIGKLDSQLLQAEDMLMVKAMAVQRTSELREVTTLFEQWRKEWGKVSAESRIIQRAVERGGAGVRPQNIAVSPQLTNFLDWNAGYVQLLENKLATLLAQSEQDKHSTARRVDDLLEDSKKLLMLPFATLTGMLSKLVRDLCRDQNKNVDLNIHGEDVEVDKRILEEMKDAFIHILRNCIDHGIESGAERARQGKPARATVEIRVSQSAGNKLEIVIADDGAGVDREAVKRAAVHHGILSEGEARGMSEGDAVNLIFHSEVSTSPIVTSISGRGLGMPIVRMKAEKLGGKIFIESERHKGTTLRIILPLTLTTFRGVLVMAAGQTFVVPTVHVERVVRVKKEEIQTVENRETMLLEGRTVSLARLESVLELPPKAAADAGDGPLSVLVLHSGDQRIGFVVGSVLYEEEVLVKALRKPLVRVRNIAGATVLASGKAVLVLNVLDLMKSARSCSPVAAPAVAAAPERQGDSKHILVVEDSITSRMLLKGILESAGYQVRTAVDGMDAFTILRETEVDVVVSDVEMPRMNGFNLTARIRADKRLADMPVVLVTALESREERERGIDAGANAYIIKSSFDQSNLLEVLRRLA